MQIRGDSEEVKRNDGSKFVGTNRIIYKKLEFRLNP